MTAVKYFATCVKHNRKVPRAYQRSLARLKRQPVRHQRAIRWLHRAWAAYLAKRRAA